MKNKLLITIFMCVCSAALVILCVLPKLTDDSKIPVIIIHSSDMTYTDGDETRMLLDSVTAYDAEDGDISDNVRVYDIAVLLDGERAAITYGVYDSDNNLAKATRIVNYVAPEIPSNTDAPQTPEGGDGQNETPGDESGQNGLSGEGYDDPELESTGSPVIRLLTHEITVYVGEEFYLMDYVDTAVDDKDSLSFLYRHMYLEGDELDTSAEGDYELEYYCVDSDENRSNMAKLMVHVVSAGSERNEE